ALVWSFFLVIPLQYVLVGVQWYGFFSIMIPVYAFLFVTARLVLAGETERFLERAATIQWGLMTCVYCISYAPALLLLDIKGYEGENAKLLFFLVVVVQLSDVFQYIWGKLFGRHPIAPGISPNKTWEGFLGGIVCAVLLGTSLWWITPFNPWQAALMALAIALMGFVGGLVMSAVKRDRGVKDYGSLIEGHGGVLDGRGPSVKLVGGAHAERAVDDASRPLVTHFTLDPMDGAVFHRRYAIENCLAL